MARDFGKDVMRAWGWDGGAPSFERITKSPSPAPDAHGVFPRLTFHAFEGGMPNEEKQTKAVCGKKVYAVARTTTIREIEARAANVGDTHPQSVCPDCRAALGL